MRTIALMALAALPLFAGFFPSTVHTTITSVEKNHLSLKSALPVNGMSGVVVHRYGNGSEAVTTLIEQTTSTGDAKILSRDMIHHDALPTIKTAIAKGDTVIGGYLYNNVLLLAPDAATYARITSEYSKKWIHPDHFALFLNKEGETVPTKATLSKFAKTYQVGLICIVRHNEAVLFDPVSQKVVGKKPIKNLPTQGKAPFFMRFDAPKGGLFSSGDTVGYYQTMGSLL